MRWGDDVCILWSDLQKMDEYPALASQWAGNSLKNMKQQFVGMVIMDPTKGIPGGWIRKGNG